MSFVKDKNVTYLKKKDWHVRPIELSEAQDFVYEHHYAHGGSNTRVSTFGLFYEGDNQTIHGISWWLPPAYGAAAYVSNDTANVLALSRFCCRPDRPENAGSYLIGQSIKMLEARYHTLLTYADIARQHRGGLYYGSNWQNQGLSTLQPYYYEIVKHPVTGEEIERFVSRKKGKKTYNHQEMLDMGYLFKGKFKKHRFTFNRNGLIIDPTEKMVFNAEGKIILTDKTLSK